MGFRRRLQLFFALIVIVPMMALTVVLFALTTRAETGKADAGLVTAAQAAVGLHAESAADAEEALREVGSDPELRAAIASGSNAERRLRELVAEPRGIVAIQLRLEDRSLLIRAGSGTAVAHRTSPLAVEGRTVGNLSVSVTEGAELAGRVKRLTNLEVVLLREGGLLAGTLSKGDAEQLAGPRGRPRDFVVGSEAYRGRVERVESPGGPPLEVAVLTRAAPIDARISQNRILIGGLLLAFLLLAVGSAVFVSHALSGQIGQFLTAARRLARGDFTHPVPTEGEDEFAALGREFNSMSSQLESKIEEVELKHQELEETIRRVGDALATGLDRHGVVSLSVRQAVEGCGAEAGRALPLDREAFSEVVVGELDPGLEAAVQAAERAAFLVGPELTAELLEPLNADGPPPRPRHAVSGSAGNTHALAVAMRALLGDSGPEYLGVISIARRGGAFSREAEELLEYLASQAVVSIENASLHETVERQAVTDELTGLANLRAFHSIMDREIQRCKRFDTPLGLVMMDLDDFKQVNDRHGHQQGDEVLASVANVLRDVCRELDAPVRYGGEELAVVLPQTDADGAALLAERMRHALEETQVPRLAGRGTLGVTASFGVAALPENALAKNDLIAAADSALYRAKRAGKNRVERAEPVTAPG